MPPTPPVNNAQRLARVGPIDPAHGYPLWYEDGSGVRLELGLAPDPNLPIIGEVPNPGAPLSIPGNFPDESFYFAAEAEMDIGGDATLGRARLILALEAAFGGAGAPAVDTRVVFARLRVRMDDLVPGAEYVVTHPYGVTEPLPADDRGRVFWTEDLGIGDQQFDLVVSAGRVAPFLRMVTGAPAGYLGDGATAGQIIGSPFGTNVFQVEGPGVADGVDPALRPDPTNPDLVATDRFVVQGKVATRVGVSLTRASYTRKAGALSVTVHAASDPGQTIELDTPRTALTSHGADYTATVNVAALPTRVAVVNLSDSPLTRGELASELTDLVIVDDASWQADTQLLTVSARSSDDTATLTAVGFGALTGSPTTFAAIGAVPSDVVVTSSAGGNARRAIVVTGPSNIELPPIAVAGPDASIAVGRQFALDGTASRGATAWSWSQLSGDLVTLTSSGATASFTAPATPGTVAFELTVSGPAGTHSDTVTVTVTPAPPADTLLVDSCEYRTSKRQFRVRGTCTGEFPNTVTVSFNGVQLGTSPVDAAHTWDVRTTLGAAQNSLVPSVGDQVQVTSTNAGSATATITIRN